VVCACISVQWCTLVFVHYKVHTSLYIQVHQHKLMYTSTHTSIHECTLVLHQFAYIGVCGDEGVQWYISMYIDVHQCPLVYSTALHVHQVTRVYSGILSIQ